MKRSIAFVLALLLLVVPAVLAKDAGNRDVFKVGAAKFISESEFTVPISAVHDEALAALDVPLTWSNGATLTKVSFENSAVAGFDFKIANIDGENNRVTIGLINMVNAPKSEPYMKPAAFGDNVLATLHFRLDDPSLQSLEIAAFTTEEPTHALMYVYNEYIDGVPHVRDLAPELTGGTVDLVARAGSNSVLPAAFALDQNVPNPFNPSTQISFALPAAAKVTLRIYNVLGQEVKTLVDTDMRAGFQTVTWDGTNVAGQATASGVYFYKLSAGDFTATKKMLMLK